MWMCVHICERVPVCACVCVVGEVTGGGISVFLCCFVCFHFLSHRLAAKTDSAEGTVSQSRD